MRAIQLAPALLRQHQELECHHQCLSPAARAFGHALAEPHGREARLDGLLVLPAAGVRADDADGSTGGLRGVLRAPNRYSPYQAIPANIPALTVETLEHQEPTSSQRLTDLELIPR